ncbi:MAG: hypothetical protein M0Z51_02065 [Propionibacterium sp.]|nr:hypothetical protein [Propionibacterium sp.]
MSDFVDQCRREWKRLGVPRAVADDMATDLANDLADAEAEGISAEEFLGSSALDPRSFAAVWAQERGVVPRSAGGEGALRGSRGFVAFTVLASITLAVAVVLLATGEPRVSLVARRSGPGPFRLNGGASGVAEVVSASAAAPI